MKVCDSAKPRVCLSNIAALLQCYVCRVATGTAHGLGIVDFLQRRVIYAKCTLNPAGRQFSPVCLLFFLTMINGLY